MSRALVALALLGCASAQSAAQVPRLAVQGPTTSLGVVIGTSWRGDTQPYPQARIRLRDVDTGRGIARTVSDGDGRFRFDRAEPGAYVVELLSASDQVLATGDLFGVVAGGQAITFVRLGAKAPWFGGFFGNAAAAAISAASTLGVTAVGSNGSPASAQ
jgi:hypothetical protein